MTAPLNSPRTPPFKTAGAVSLVILAAVLAAMFFQFRGDFTAKTKLTMIASRAGLVMDPGSKVTYNGVEIGRVATVQEVDENGQSKARFTLEVNPKYIKQIPANVDAKIQATTVFGNKYVALSSPKNPAPQRISGTNVIDVSLVSTEFNTLFESVVSITDKIDPIKVNATLSAAAQALDELGEKFGQSLVNGNNILDDLDVRMPQFRYDTQQLAALGD